MACNNATALFIIYMITYTATCYQISNVATCRTCLKAYIQAAEWWPFGICDLGFIGRGNASFLYVNWINCKIFLFKLLIVSISTIKYYFHVVLGSCLKHIRAFPTTSNFAEEPRESQATEKK